jgi:ATP-dependent RNA helicase DDX18/HAS1
VLSYHSAIEVKTRVDNLKDFTKKLLPQPVILICTDRASRGIDFASFNVNPTYDHRALPFANLVLSLVAG